MTWNSWNDTHGIGKVMSILRRCVSVFRLVRPLILAPAVVSEMATAAAQPVHVLEPVRRIGVLEGPEPQMFGRIIDVAADVQGNLFVLEASTPEIRWFDSTGAFRGTGGRKGRGPGELLQPVSLLVAANGRVFVLDARNRRISEYVLASSRLAHVRDVRLAHRATGFCVLGEHVFTVGAPDEKDLIQEISPAGKVIASFGTREQPSRELVERLGAKAAQTLRAEFNVATLYCDAPSKRLIVLYSSAPFVRAYSPDGTLLWSKELRDFHYPEPGVAHEGTLAWSYSGTGLWSGGKSVFMDQNQHVFVAIVVTQSRGEGWADMRVLASNDGMEIERFKGQEVFATHAGDYVYGYRQNPFPQVVQYKLRHSHR